MYGIVMMAALTAGSESPDFFKHKSGGCYGCYGYGCYSATHHSGNGFHHGCSSSCNGWYSCAGCCGGTCYGGACYGTWSCWGCYGCWGTSPYYPMYMAPAEPKKEEKKEEKKSQLEQERGKLVVEVPADAKLFIDDQPMKTTSAVRTFHTPKIDQAQTYYYILRVEIDRDGTTHSESKRVIIRAGEEVRAQFTETSIVSASRSGTTASR